MPKLSLVYGLIIAVIVTVISVLTSSDKIKQAHLNSSVSRTEYSQLSKYSQKQVECLANNIYREAVGEPKEGWLAVGFVTMNRVNSGKFPHSVCDVVYQKTGKIFQFSWVGSKKRLSKIDDAVYNEILKIATFIYVNNDKLKDNTNGATYYHASYVKPNWKNLERTNQIGRHIFYKPNEI